MVPDCSFIIIWILHMKMFTDRNNCHVSDRFPYTYYKITTNKSAINIVNWNYTVSTSIVKIRFPKFNITAGPRTILIQLTNEF